LTTPEEAPISETGRIGQDAQGHESMWGYRNQTTPGHLPFSHPEENGDHCFCVDYRKLNDIIQKECFQLSKIDNVLDMLARAKWFSTMDLRDVIGT
jgi:hypothetical protein